MNAGKKLVQSLGSCKLCVLGGDDDLGRLPPAPLNPNQLRILNVTRSATAARTGLLPRQPTTTTGRADEEQRRRHSNHHQGQNLLHRYHLLNIPQAQVLETSKAVIGTPGFPLVTNGSECYWAEVISASSRFSSGLFFNPRLLGNTALLFTLCVSSNHSLQAQTPVPTLDTRPAFLQVVTNFVLRTNPIVVTNYVVLTNTVVVTNYYNAQGVLLQPVTTPPGLVPIPPTPPPAPAPAPAPPDPAVVKAGQLQALRDLLVQGLAASSNKLAAAGSFTVNSQQQIQVPSGLTSFDRKKTAALVNAMNLTAEKAAPGVIGVLTKAAGQFPSDDPAAVIKGSTDAATRGFFETQRTTLDPQVMAVVQQVSADTRLRETYSSVMLKGGGLLGAVLGSGPSVDIEAHVAQGLLQAIANQLAAQEKTIRSDAAARKTPALQQAFK